MTAFFYARSGSVSEVFTRKLVVLPLSGAVRASVSRTFSNSLSSSRFHSLGFPSHVLLFAVHSFSSWDLAGPAANLHQISTTSCYYGPVKRSGMRPHQEKRCSHESGLEDCSGRCSPGRGREQGNAALLASQKHPSLCGAVAGSMCVAAAVSGLRLPRHGGTAADGGCCVRR
jgi:hypothetical protein